MDCLVRKKIKTMQRKKRRDPLKATNVDQELLKMFK
jgi:hypothetical protein